MENMELTQEEINEKNNKLELNMNKSLEKKMMLE